jgi:hypothetical protein
MKKKIRDADVALAFSVDAHFVGPATGLNIGGRNKDIWSYQEAEPISDRAKRLSFDFFGDTSFGTNNLFHRRSMRVSGLPLFIQSIERYKLYPLYDIRTFITERDASSPTAPDGMSSGEISTANDSSITLRLHLCSEDWEDFQKVATHPKGVRFQLWFSEQIQKACSSLEGMNYHIKTDIEGISKEADLGDGSSRRNSYQTIKEFDILHHGDLLQNPVHFWAKFKSFGF